MIVGGYGGYGGYIQYNGAYHHPLSESFLTSLVERLNFVGPGDGPGCTAKLRHMDQHGPAKTSRSSPNSGGHAIGQPGNQLENLIVRQMIVPLTRTFA